MLEHLNELYSLEESYNDFPKTATQGLIANDFSDMTNFKRISVLINMTMADLFYLEKELIAQYQRCLKLIEDVGM